MSVKRAAGRESRMYLWEVTMMSRIQAGGADGEGGRRTYLQSIPERQTTE